jgi:glucosamine 6-phosphate synthetase-like amidotransferase/phosphosugar isomerase protein
MQPLLLMCGIFAYMGFEPLAISEVLKVMRGLERAQEPSEETPVGGHGAGIAVLDEKNEFTLAKVGNTGGSPVDDLTLHLREVVPRSQFILGHVRRASKEFESTIRYGECSQPYKPNCITNISLVSAHNGFLSNYQELKNKLSSSHKFESQGIELIDSEVIAHLFEELLYKFKDTAKATHTASEQIRGRNTAVMLTSNQHEADVNIIQEGKTRGLAVWTNTENEVVLCSREQPLEKALKRLLSKRSFQKIITISRNEAVNLEAHFNMKL